MRIWAHPGTDRGPAGLWRKPSKLVWNQLPSISLKALCHNEPASWANQKLYSWPVSFCRFRPFCSVSHPSNFCLERQRWVLNSHLSDVALFSEANNKFSYGTTLVSSSFFFNHLSREFNSWSSHYSVLNKTTWKNNKLNSPFLTCFTKLLSFLFFWILLTLWELKITYIHIHPHTYVSMSFYLNGLILQVLVILNSTSWTSFHIIKYRFVTFFSKG